MSSTRYLNSAACILMGNKMKSSIISRKNLGITIYDTGGGENYIFKNFRSSSDTNI